MTAKTLFQELEELMINSAEYSHPCDSDKGDITLAHGRVSIHEIHELLERHRKNFHGLVGKNGETLSGTVICQDHYEDEGRRNYSESYAEGEHDVHVMKWISFVGDKETVCCDCHDGSGN